MRNPATEPVEVELDRARELRIRWADGHLSVLPLPLLRSSCPCATCRGDREQPAKGAQPGVQSPAAQREMAMAETAELVGQYALRVIWKDGHDTGIYDYELLRSLGPAETDPKPSG